MPMRLCVTLLVLALGLPGCAGRAWRAAREADSASAYHRFLRGHETSRYAEDAEARLAMVRVRDKPSQHAFDVFQANYPESPLLDELRPYIEEPSFIEARTRGAVSAYQEFLESFPDGVFALRARGNLEYLVESGFGGSPSELGGFADRHPESDYAAEAQRSRAAADLRLATAFNRVGLIIEVPDSIPSSERLVGVFGEKVSEAYAASKLELVALSSIEDPKMDSVSAYLMISHRETSTETELESGRSTQSGVLAQTHVTLVSAGMEAPVWANLFELRVAMSERRPGVSVLFGPGATAYWSEFFIPIAAWNTRYAIREPRTLPKPVVAVEVVGSLAIALFGDGDFEALDLTDPVSPLRVAAYRRPRDLARFEGLTLIGDRVVMYGPDGIEIVRLDLEGPTLEAVYGPALVGSVVGVVEGSEHELIVASDRGLLWIESGASQVSIMLPREILGLARSGERLLFCDGVSLFISTRALLEAGRVEGELRFGRRFGPTRVRVAGTSVLVLGERGTAWVDLSTPSSPRVRSRMGAKEVGEVRDAAVVGNRLFLLGARGLQVSDPSGERIVDSADVRARDRLEVTGRHLVMIGGKQIQVVDATPFLVRRGAAAPR